MSSNVRSSNQNRDGAQANGRSAYRENDGLLGRNAGQGYGTTGVNAATYQADKRWSPSQVFGFISLSIFTIFGLIMVGIVAGSQTQPIDMPGSDSDSEEGLKYPEDAYWARVSDAPTCSTLGFRTRSAVLHDIPDVSNGHILEGCSSVLLDYRPPQTCRIEEMNGDKIVIGTWQVADKTCQPIWESAVPGSCVEVRLRSFTASIGYLPEGLNDYDACVNTPVIVENGLPLQRQHCTRTAEGVVVAKGVVETEYCNPTLSHLETMCSAPGERHYISKVIVPPGLDPLYSCQHTGLLLGEKSYPPEQCVFASDESIEAHWHRSEDLDCTAIWDHTPKPDGPCLSFGKRRYTAVLRHIASGLDMYTVCRATTAFVKEHDWLLPDECEETVDHFMRGVWVVEDPQCPNRQISEVTAQGRKTLSRLA